MTGQLRVRVECGYANYDAGAVITMLVGNVYALTPGNPSLRQVRLPLGWNVDPVRFDLPAGQYSVEASLPSGQILTEDVEVVDDMPVTVQLDLTESSPYESHTLQYVVGNIEPKRVYHNDETYPVPRSLGSRSFARADFGADGAAEERQAAVVLLEREKPERLPIELLNDLRQRTSSDALSQIVESLGPLRQASLQPTFPQPLSPIYRFDGGDRHSPTSYQYITVAAAGDAYLVTVPWQWRTTDQRTAAVDVMVNLRQSPTGSPVSVVVNDPAVSAGLGHLSAGSLDKAAVLFSDTVRMLYTKMNNPIAAVAGGYVLIGTDPGVDDRFWDDWLGNLRRRFPELSDGAVLWGSRRLRTAREQKHVDQAREALLEGFHRGLPVFTLGLTWLVEGLSAFPEDPQCAAALLQVRQLCWQVDMREPFVVLRLGGT